MIDEELRRRAAAMGVTVSYTDGLGREVTVPDQTLAAILDVLHDAPPPGAPSPGAGLPGASALAAPAPSGRSWGFTVQLYALRSRDSWGHGDLRDLAEFAAWSARDLGAGFVLINPLHAAEPLPPVSASPYLPMSRRFISPLYLRVEDIEEYEGLEPSERAVVTALGKPLRAASTTSALIDRDAVWTAKRAALERIRRVPLRASRQAALDAFRLREGQALEDWATWCAIAERRGPDYRSWPPRLRDPRSAEVAELRGELAERVLDELGANAEHLQKGANLLQFVERALACGGGFFAFFIGYERYSKSGSCAADRAVNSDCAFVCHRISFCA